jgi:hypothetical protein
MEIGTILRILLPAFALAGLAAPAGAVQPEPQRPAAQPEDVNAIHDTSATLSATVSPMGLLTAYVFEWGPTVAYGANSPPTLIEDRTMPLRVKHTLTGLQPGTRYHWRVVAANVFGETFSAQRSFTTDGTGPAAAQGAEDPAEPAPPPQRSSSATAVRKGGKVRVRRKGRKDFEIIDSQTSIPFGSIVDARRGKVRVVTEIDAAGTTQAATFRRGLFELRQPEGGDGTVDVLLRGGNFKRRCRRAGKSLAHAARVPTRDAGRVVRRLWASDRHGRFRMHGRNSVATVRGTRWEMIDHCNGTVTRVTEGAVDVRDRRTGRTVRVRAGRSHFSRARR